MCKETSEGLDRGSRDEGVCSVVPAGLRWLGFPSAEMETPCHPGVLASTLSSGDPSPWGKRCSGPASQLKHEPWKDGTVSK